MLSDCTLTRRVEAALDAASFAANGALITDLDGTAVHQDGDRVVIEKRVQLGLERVRTSGRPVIINTLRFPLSIMRTFGEQWSEWTRKPLPCVTLNGSLIGDIVRSDSGELVFDERCAFPLLEAEIESVLTRLEAALRAGFSRFTVFVYSRTWQDGEVIWTPSEARVQGLVDKYVSASVVVADGIEGLRHRLLTTEICMIAVQLEEAGDNRLAFQHANASNFFTRAGVDKRSGAIELTRLLSADFACSIGAGDTELDTFLDGVGLSLHVGPADLKFKGRLDTLRLEDPIALGAILSDVVAYCERTIP